MANPFRSTRYFRIAQSFATTRSPGDNVHAADEATHCANAATLDETKGRLNRCACDPARGAQRKWRQRPAVPLDQPTRVAPAWPTCQTQSAKTNILSQTLAGRVG